MTKQGHRGFLEVSELRKPRKLEGWPLRVNDRREDRTSFREKMK